MTYIIYADVLFLINFILDFLCLYISGVLRARRVLTLRIAAGAFFGGAYSLLAEYLFEAPWYFLFPMHISSALLIVLISYGKEGILKNAVAFAVTASALGGIMCGIFSLSGKFFMYSGGFYAEISPVFLLAVAIFSVTVTYVYAVICKKRMAGGKIDAEISADHRTWNITLLLDSGCFVTDPISGRNAVIVASEVFGNNAPEALRAIPISTAGGTKILFGFKPERFTLKPVAKPKKDIDVIVALDTETVSFAGLDGIISPALCV